MLFKIHAEKNASNKKVFLYDNMTNTLSTEDGVVFEYGDIKNKVENRNEYISFSVDKPLKKSKDVSILKIQLGLSCNYSCDYCSQRFVERPKETTKKDIDAFITKLRHLNFDERRGLKIEMWGGEPFVYWKTMKPLVEALKEEFADWKEKPQFSVITNGSILTEEICDWLIDNNFYVAISHDGPGQSVRGPDPFDDPETKRLALNLYNRLRPIGRMSFNSMMNSKNSSRKEVFDWFVNFTGDPDVALGEGALVDAYDEGGLANSLVTKQDHFNFRRKAFSDIFSTGGAIGFHGIVSKIDHCTRSILSHSEAKYLGQKCGMDDERVIAVDLRGDVITCQNVSAVDINSNGQPHVGGNITDIENVKITTSTHWSNRPHCSSCPVLSVCGGSCMFVSGKYWDQSCANAYSDAVALFALSIEKITGYIPVLIEAEGLPLHRQDIWGTVYEHKEDPIRKTIPIAVVSAKQEVEGVEVFTQSKRVENT
jgi:uncharacterized protein